MAGVLSASDEEGYPTLVGFSIFDRFDGPNVGFCLIKFSWQPARLLDIGIWLSA